MLLKLKHELQSNSCFSFNKIHVILHLWCYNHRYCTKSEILAIINRFHCLYKSLSMYLQDRVPSDTGLDKHTFERKIVNIFLPISFNIYFWCSKELSRLEGSFVYPQHMFFFFGTHS